MPHRFVLRLPPDLFRQLDAIGRVHSQQSHKQRSTNDEIVDACRAWVSRFEREHGPIDFIYHYIVFESDEAAQRFQAQAHTDFAGLKLAGVLPEGENTILTYESPRLLTASEQERFRAEINRVEGVLEYTLNIE